MCDLVARVLALAEHHHVDRSNFELQMLYGMGDPYKRALVQQGYRVARLRPLRAAHRIPGLSGAAIGREHVQQGMLVAAAWSIRKTTLPLNGCWSTRIHPFGDRGGHCRFLQIIHAPNPNVAALDFQMSGYRRHKDENLTDFEQSGPDCRTGFCPGTHREVRTSTSCSTRRTISAKLKI